MPTLCCSSFRDKTELFPSRMASISTAKRRLIERSERRLLASMIHTRARRVLCRAFKGIGTCIVLPPCFRDCIRKMGLASSTASYTKGSGSEFVSLAICPSISAMYRSAEAFLPSLINKLTRKCRSGSCRGGRASAEYIYVGMFAAETGVVDTWFGSAIFSIGDISLSELALVDVAVSLFGCSEALFIASLRQV